MTGRHRPRLLGIYLVLPAHPPRRGLDEARPVEQGLERPWRAVLTERRDRTIIPAMLITRRRGLIGVVLGYITRSTAAAAGAVGWLLLAEQAILHRRPSSASG